MTNEVAIGLIVSLIVPNLLILVRLLAIDYKKSKDRLLLLMAGVCVSLLGWQIDYLVYFISSDADVIRFTYDFKLPFVAFTTFFIAMLVLRFYRLEYLVGRTAILIMLIIPIFTLIYSCLSPNNDLIRESFSIVQTAPVHEVVTTRGIWFWVHTVSCYAFLIGSLVVSLYCHNKLPRTYRTPSFILLIGLSVVIITNMIYLFGIGFDNFDISILGGSISIIAVYFAVVRNKGVDFIISVRKEIYDYLSEGIVILNDDRYVVYINESAKLRINELNLSIINKLYDTMFEKAVSFATNIEAAPADEDGLDMTFIRDGSERIFNLSEKPIKDNFGVPIGTFIVVNEVTKNRAIISKLENIGGIDALTGLPNRRSMEKFMANIDNPEKLPLGIIAGDINGLKKVNDNLGHKQGDLLIRLVSEIMTDVCPTRGRVSRIGGDEFLIAIPDSSEDEIEDIIYEITSIMENNRDYMFKPSVSFGYELKDEMTQDIEDVISSADEKMYAAKRAGRKSYRKE